MLANLMIEYISPKWILFVKRPGSLLRREFRKDCYLYVDTLTNLRVSQILVIGEKSINLTFLKKNEDDKNYCQIKEDYQGGEVEKYFRNFRKIIRETKSPGENLKKIIQGLRRVGPVPLYAHYLEKILTQANQQLSRLKGREKDRLLDLIKQNSEFLDKAIKISDRYYEKAYHFFKERYLGYKDIDYYLIDELVHNKKVKTEEVKSRKRFFVQIISKDKTVIYTKQEARKILKKEKFIAKKVKISLTDLKGLAVYPGKAIGRVTIVKELSDFNKFSKREIIVSPMTLIYFTSYLKKVKAIVTDEGGINCHAAITAREFKIPCITGTKIATQILKDGDKVEVDANKGIVKILK